MRSSLFVAGLFCYLLAACSGGREEKPTLDDAKLARIMADLSTGLAATNGLSGFEKDSLAQAYYQQVFEIHGTTPEVYEKDLKIISSDMNHLQAIVDSSIRLFDLHNE